MNVIQAIRQTEFPDSVLFALKEMYLCLEKASQQETGIPGLGASQEDLAREISEQFVLFQQPGVMKLNAIQELQVIQMMCEFFKSTKDRRISYALFNTLFGDRDQYSRRGTCPVMLKKLVSMAIAVAESNILDCASIWIKNQGYDSSRCVDLGQNLINDYCLLVPTAATSLQKLPEVSTEFTKTFITLATVLYSSTEKKITEPLYELLEIITNWLFSDPSLCVTSQQTPLVFQNQGQESPLCGLAEWTVLAPLHNTSCMLQKDNHSTTDKNKNLHILYAKLHLSLLQSFSYLKNAKTGARGVSKVITIDQVRSLVQKILVLSAGVEDVNVETCLDRLGQILQVSMATAVLSCHQDELVAVLKPLCHNRMIQIFLSHNCAGNIDR